MKLLEGLHAASDPSSHLHVAPVAMPVKPHAHRVPAVRRGVSVAFVRAVCRFFAKSGGVGGELAQVIGGSSSGLGVTLSTLTAHTGLSLVESCMLHAARLGIDCSMLFGSVTTHVSYATGGASLGEVGVMVQRALRRLQSMDERIGGGQMRYLWLDALCSSPNLATGRYLLDGGRSLGEESSRGTPEHAARTEEYGPALDATLHACHEQIVYLTPLVDGWTAPACPPLDPSLGATPRPGGAGHSSRGPRALQRAWVLSELATVLARQHDKGADVRVVFELRPADALLVREMLESPGGVGALLELAEGVDVASAQLATTAERVMVAPMLSAAGGGGDDALVVVNERLRGAIRAWLVDTAFEALEAFTARVSSPAPAPSAPSARSPSPTPSRHSHRAASPAPSRHSRASPSPSRSFSPFGGVAYDDQLGGAPDATTSYTSYAYAPPTLVRSLCTLLRACGREHEARRYEGWPREEAIGEEDELGMTRATW